MRRSPVLSLAVAAIALGLAAPPGVAQGGAAPLAGSPPATFFDTLDLQLVSVDVVVTDRDGRPVTDLQLEDFEVFEDGRPVTISHFGAPSAATAGDAPAEAPAADDAATVETPTAPPPPGHHVVVFVDQTNLGPGSPQRLIPPLSQLVRERLGPADRVMVVTYDGNVRIRAQLSGGPEVDVGIFERLQAEIERTPSGRHEERRLFQEVQGATTLGSQQLTEADLATDLMHQVRAYQEGRYAELVSMAAALEQFVNGLASLEGPKTLIYVNDGVPGRVGEDILRVIQARFGGSSGVNVELELQQFDTLPLLQAVADHANANRVTFNVLTAGGAALSALSPEFGSNDGTSYTETLATAEEASRSGLRFLAETTGGLVGTGMHQARTVVSRVADSLAATYSLAYTPAEKPDGKRHRLEVRVRRPGVKVRHREAYLAQTSDDRMADRTLGVLLLEHADNPLQVAVEIGEATPGEKKGQWLVPLLVKVPIGRIVLLPQGQVHEGRLSIFLGVRDRHGGMSPVHKAAVPVRVPNQQLLTALGQSAGFRLSVLMEAGEHAVAVGVRDEIGHVESAILTRHTPEADGTAR